MFGFGKKRATGSKIPGIEIETYVLDDQLSQSVDRLMLDSPYGHIVKLSRYYALYTVPVSIKGSVQDTRQLWFQKSRTEGARFQSWEWEILLQPDRVPETHQELLVCSEKKNKTREEVTLTVNADAIGIQDILSIEVKIG
jgi:hypothetical protein